MSGQRTFSPGGLAGAFSDEDDENDLGIPPGQGDEDEEGVQFLGEDDDEGRDWDGEARAMGWHPLPGPGVSAADAYRGDPATWLPAREFVEFAESNIKVMRNRLRQVTNRNTRLEAEVGTLKNTQAEQAEAIKYLRKLAKSADDAGYKRAREEILAERKEAVAAGDEEAFEQAEERLTALDKGREALGPEPPEPAAPPVPVAIDPDIQAFIDANPWMKTDSRLRGAMIARHNIVAAENPGWTMGRQLAKALLNLQRDFPQDFPEGEEDDDPVNPPRDRRPAAAMRPRSGATPPPRRGASPFDRIEDPKDRADARAAFERLKRQDPDATAEEYVTLLEDPHADILAMRRARKK